MKSRDEVSVSAQVRFGEDGSLEADTEVETDWSDWGVDTDTRERERRYEEPRASEFGVDDRAVTVESQSDQETLFVDVDDDQQTLGGEQACEVWKW